MNEIWKPVVGFEGLYEVSNLGRFKSLAKKPGIGINHRFMVDRLIPGYKVKGKYIQVQLWRNGKYIVRGIHKLVLEAFNPAKEKGIQCNHKDGNKNNNKIDNLEWVTPKENIHHAFKTGLCDHRRGEKLYNAKLKEEDVVWIRNNFKQNTYQKLAEMFNVTKGCIYHIITRRNWKHI